MATQKIMIATGNAGKLRDFQSVARLYGIEVCGLAALKTMPAVLEGGLTFAENACKKAAAYSRLAPGELVLADDSGLEVDALDGAPGVHSARYAALEPGAHADAAANIHNSSDAANNARLLREMLGVPDGRRGGQFKCIIAAGKDGLCLPELFEGEIRGSILRAPRGNGGFGYDPLFYLEELGKTFAELTPGEKAEHSHRGRAFRSFLRWSSRRRNTGTTSA